jgi:hypothetical protein
MIKSLVIQQPTTNTDFILDRTFKIMSMLSNQNLEDVEELFYREVNAIFKFKSPIYTINSDSNSITVVENDYQFTLDVGELENNEQAEYEVVLVQSKEYLETQTLTKDLVDALLCNNVCGIDTTGLYRVKRSLELKQNYQLAEYDQLVAELTVYFDELGNQRMSLLNRVAYPTSTETLVSTIIDYLTHTQLQVPLTGIANRPVQLVDEFNSEDSYQFIKRTDENGLTYWEYGRNQEKGELVFIDSNDTYHIFYQSHDNYYTSLHPPTQDFTPKFSFTVPIGNLPSSFFTKEISSIKEVFGIDTPPNEEQDKVLFITHVHVANEDFLMTVIQRPNLGQGFYTVVLDKAFAPINRVSNYFGETIIKHFKMPYILKGALT